MSTGDDSRGGTGGRKKVLIFIVCFNDEKSIEGVLGQIPKDVFENTSFETEILIIDNHSSDRTFYAARDFADSHPQWKFTILYNPRSQGYGGSQKIGFRYAIKNGFDAVVLLHGNGRYAPQQVGEMIGPVLAGEGDAVLGSRMIRQRQALKNGMPLYKWIGNIALTFVQNSILMSRLSEFHSGYRAYSVRAIEHIPYEHNSDGFDFDTDIIIQLLDTGNKIKEIAVPTFWGSEIAGAHGLRYSLRVLCSSILSRVMRLGIYYHPKFDYEPETNYRYREKFGYPSSHQFALEQVKAGTTVVDIGCGPGFMAEQLARKNVRTISIDRQIQQRTREHSSQCIEADADKYDFADDFGKVDYVLALDIVEHLKSPEQLLRVLRERFSRDCPTVIITTGNIAFLPLRVSLLFAGFHYGRRGILDMDHTRLFTFSSLRRTLRLNGYEVVSCRGLPAPFPLAVGNGLLARFLLLVNRMLIAVSKSVFSYQIAVISRPLPTVEHLLQEAHEAKHSRVDVSDFEKR